MLERMKKQLSYFTLALSLVIFVFTNTCLAQYSPTFQDASSVGKGNGEVTGVYSRVGFSFQGERGPLFDNFGIQAGYGISKQIEIRFRYDRFNIIDGNERGFNAIWLGPKFSSSSQKLAFYLPVGMITSSISNNRLITEPSFIFTLPLSENVRINLTPSYLLFFQNINPFLNEDLIKLNIGIGVALGENWELRPEGGFLFFASDFDANYFNIGLGLSRKIIKSN